MDRKTIKKYYENNGIPLRKSSNRSSKWDPYTDEILSLMNITGVTKMSVYRRLEAKYKDRLPGNYNSFKAFTLRKGISLKLDDTPHPLYEVDPGKQIQVDWKENMCIHLKDGTEITFNVYSATLGYSREHIFIYSSTKTTEDFIRCTIEAFRRIGGVTEELLTDNMTAIVSVRGENKKVYPEISQFFKDMGVRLNLARVRTPQTKGKDENSNKFVKWIIPYDYDIGSEDELIDIIENVICSQANQQINTGTNMPPAALFKHEKEYLKALPNKIMLESYLKEHYKAKVDSTMLFYYRGKRYSVPPEYINKSVDLYPIGDEIYVYFNNKLVTKHTISQNPVNYKTNHYKDGMFKRLRNNEEIDIEEMAEKNLKRLEMLGKNK